MAKHSRNKDDKTPNKSPGREPGAEEQDQAEGPAVNAETEATKSGDQPAETPVDSGGADDIDQKAARTGGKEETHPAGAQAETPEKAGTEEKAETEDEIPEEDDLTEPAVKTIEVDEEEMLFTRRKVKNLEEETRKLNNELKALRERMLRLTAEYENYRNRTAREKDEIEADSVAKVLADILPVMDNLERALISETDDLPGLKDGVQMTLDQFIVAMQKMGVELIPTDNGFDPEYHEAVMHELDEAKGEKEITEVFLKGYKKGDKVVRHSVVKVVN